MAWAKDANLGTAAPSGTGSSAVLTTTAAAAANTWIFLVVGSFGTETVTGVADSGGLIWELVGESNNGNVRAVLARAFAAGGLGSGSTITATFSGTTAERKIGAVSFTGGQSNSPTEDIDQTSASTAAWSAAPVSATDGALVVGVCTLNTNGSTTVDANSVEDLDFQFTGSSASCLYHRFTTTAGSNPVGGTWNAAVAWAAMGTAVALEAPPLPPPPDGIYRGVRMKGASSRYG
jgi:hypothetical protein